MYISSRSCKIEQNVLVGANTHISDKSRITNSIIGSDCKIGENVTISDSYIQNGVIIKNNCTITKSFIDNNVTVEDDSTLEHGTLIVANAIIDKGSELKGNIILNSDNNHNGMYEIY